MPAETLQNHPETEPTLDAYMNMWQQGLERLEAEVDQFAGTREFPDWWFEEVPNSIYIAKGLKEQGLAVQNVENYYQLYTTEETLRSRIMDRKMYDHPFGGLIDRLGGDTVAQAMQGETPDGALHQLLLENMDYEINNKQLPSRALHVLKDYYGTGSFTELLGAGGDVFDGATNERLINPVTLRNIRYLDNATYDPDLSREQNNEFKKKWMAQGLAAAANITEAEAEPYIFSGLKTDEEANLIKIIQAFHHFGPDRIKHISKVTGIYGLEAYDIPQLERMEQLATNPGATAERLKNHDVSVVLVNRVGDHNGVLNKSAETFDGGQDNTLFFEINTMADIYRRMSQLKRLGIQPSTLVLAAHSGEGQFMVSDDRDPAVKRRDIASIAGSKLVQLAMQNGDMQPGDRAIATEDIKGMPRLLEEYMQPSRGIDDNESDIGRRKIIFQSCHMGAETARYDINEDGEKEQVAVESVISQLGTDLINSGLDSNVDIYGAPAAIQMHRTDKGARYSAKPLNMGEDRVPLHAVRIRLEKGKLHKQNVDEIALRK